MSKRSRLVRAVAVGALALTWFPAVALAAEPIPAPEGFAELRAQFEDMTAAELAAAGYVADPPICVAQPGVGGMGIHAINGKLMGEQFPAGEMDPTKPPVVLLSADQQRVVGLEWEAKDVGQGEFELFGQAVVLQPGHPGVPEPHYMLHAYFRPNGEVLFAEYDPELKCMPDTSTVGASTTPQVVPMLLIAAAAIGWMFSRRLRAGRTLG